MSYALNFAEIDGMRVELLPARTVLSLFSIDNGSVVADACTTTHTAAVPAVLGLIGGSPEQQTVICQPAAILSSGTPATGTGPAGTSTGAAAPPADATP
jgi:hypothetical protein